ncbi:MAG: hypothetical protein EHM20_05200 [Alphaproteobacteria bacterium]|nr:MAG: hypothetical protein EHM20_05200 [Alphaproteobacteria bacterium]
MKKKHGIGMSLIVTLAALIMVLLIGIVSVPSIISLSLKHSKEKVKSFGKRIKSFFRIIGS